MDDETDICWMLAKQMACAVDDADIRAFSNSAKKCGAVPGKFRYASLCSGSGLSDVGLHRMFDAFERVTKVRYPSSSCSFLCEIDPPKFAHLDRLMSRPEALGIKPYIFNDITQLAGETSET